jgi:hypothetical protein
MRNGLTILSLATLMATGCWCPDCGECGIAGVNANDFIEVDTLGYDAADRPAARVVVGAEGTCRGTVSDTRRIVEDADGVIRVQAPDEYEGDVLPLSTSDEPTEMTLTDRDWSIRQPVPEFGSEERTIFAGPDGMEVQVDCASSMGRLTCAIAD